MHSDENIIRRVAMSDSASEAKKNEYSRRDVLKTAAVMGAAMVAGGAFPMQSEAKTDSILNGVIEMHVHSDPDVRARSVNDIELCRKAKEMGMRGVVIKNHEFLTNDRAYLMRQIVSGLEVFGGIVLNYPVGGVNPDAVETMIKFSGGYGKIVWLPTYQSSYEMEHAKKKGGVRVVDTAGKVLPEVKKVIQIAAKADLILGTGHISPRESLTIIKEARQEGLRKIVVTHAMQDPFLMSLDDMKRCVEMGAIIEHCYLSYLMGPLCPVPTYRSHKHVSMDEFVKAITTLGAENCIIATDLGQSLNPVPVVGMADFITQLLKKGITQNQIDRMARQNPARLLGLDPW
jgi:hypothetical protein